MLSLPFGLRVPATCAHLGPGLGVLGLALELAFEYRVEAHDDGDEHVVERPDAHASVLDPRHDGVIVGLRQATRRWSIEVPPLRIEVHRGAPAGCGLGSYTADLLAGVRIASAFVKTPPLRDEQLDAVVAAGGDPAHASAALCGGLAIAVPLGGPVPGHRCLPAPIDAPWRLVIIAPDVAIGAAETQRAIPATLGALVAARTAGRVAGLLHAFATGDERLLGECLVDEVHVPHRIRLVPSVGSAITAMREAGAAGATISGHGPAVVAFTTRAERTNAIQAAAEEAFGRASVTCRAFVSAPGRQVGPL